MTAIAADAHGSGYLRQLELRSKKLGDLLDLLGRVEQLAAVSAAIDDFERGGQPVLLVSADQLVGLVDRHLRVLVAVIDQQRRIARIDVKHGARQAGQLRLLFRLAAKQQFQRGHSDAEAVRRRLGQDRRQIRRRRRNRRSPARRTKLLAMLADIAFVAPSSRWSRRRAPPGARPPSRRRWRSAGARCQCFRPLARK